MIVVVVVFVVVLGSFMQESEVVTETRTGELGIRDLKRTQSNATVLYVQTYVRTIFLVGENLILFLVENFGLCSSFLFKLYDICI